MGAPSTAEVAIKPKARTELVQPNQSVPCPTCGGGKELHENMFQNHVVIASYFKVKYLTECITPYKCGKCEKHWATTEELDNPMFANKDVERITAKTEITVCTGVVSLLTPCSRAYHTKCYHQLLAERKIKSGGRRKRS